MSALDEKRSPSEEKVTADRLATDDASSNDESLVPVPQAVLDESTVNNPLAGIPKAQLLRDVEIFAQEKGLTDHLEGLQRGALLAQRPADFQSIEELPQDEKDAIAHEYSHKWSHPFLLYMTIFTCSIGAATQGWDQTGSNGANLSFPVAFNIPEAASEGIAPGAPGYVSAALAERNQWIVGIVNAAPYIASAMIGCWLSDPLNNLFGRRGCIFITAVILVVTPSHPASPRTGGSSSSSVSSSESAWAPRDPPSPSLQPRTRLHRSVVPSSWAGSSGRYVSIL